MSITSRRLTLDVPWFLAGVLAVLSFLVPAAADAAEADDGFGLGNGQHGALRVQEPNVIINRTTLLRVEALTGESELKVVDTSAFSAGELVLVLQMGLEAKTGKEREETFDLDPRDVGRWELARLTVVESGVLHLTGPLLHRYPAVLSQVVRVPEYSEVRLEPGGSLRAPDWDGASGGVLALLVTGEVFNEGALLADGAGFLGGTVEFFSPEPTGCVDEDEWTENNGGGHKGEGIADPWQGSDHNAHGYGRLSNAGGGGNCHYAGGGGGGHGGRGGQGGFTTNSDGSRDVGGRGGAALRSAPFERLVLGGGGGAGSGGTSGGAGGGILFLRAREVRSSGSQGVLRANGVSAENVTGGVTGSRGGAGGGGAGGTVYVRTERLGCAVLEARGGNGGDGGSSPGGGGGGGRLFLQAEGGPEAGCAISVLAGTAGQVSGDSRGAEPTLPSDSRFAGTTDVLPQSYAAPPVPTWVYPSGGALGVPVVTQLEGLSVPGATVQVFLDGQPLAPTVALDSGSFTVVPAAVLAEGPHEVRAYAERFGLRSALTEPLGFTVSSRRALEVGCGCGAGSGSALGLAGLALLGSLGRRRVRLRTACPGRSSPS